MKSLWTLFALLIALSMQAQPYTVTEDGCRMFATDGSLDQSFLIERLMWVDRGSNSDQIMIFDGISALVVQDADLANYPTTDSLIEQMKVWIVECDTAGTAPGPVPLTALFANQKSIDLDGLAEYVQVADTADLSMVEGGSDIPFTFTTWINLSDVSDAGLINKFVTAPTANGEYSLHIDGSDKLNLALGDQTTLGIYTGAISSGTLTTYENQWIHIAAVYGGCEWSDCFTFYIDGVEITSVADSSGTYTGMKNSSQLVYVGARTLPGDYTTGKMDQVCIFRNVALTLPEIKELMTIRDVTQYTYYDSLVLYQEYDSPDSTQANGIVDLSPAGNHGTMQSGEYTDLNLCVEWPYDYQLESNTTYSNLTPMQSSIESDSSYGGFGIEYGGTTEYTSIANNALLNFTHTDSFTLSYWINTEHNGASTDYVFSKITAGIKGYGMRYGPSKDPNFLVAEDGANNVTFVADSDPISNNRWIHQVVVYENGEARIYENGDSLEVTKTPTGTVTDITNTEIAAIGRYSGFSSDYWQGTVGDLMILDRAISTQEVKAIYNQHATRNETNESLAGNIVAYYRGYNSTNVASGVLDQSGNNLHGTPTNTLDNAFQYTYPRQIFDADTAGSVDFDGLAEYIEIADSDSLSFINNAGTDDTSGAISIWVKVSDFTSQQLINKLEHAVAGEWTLYTNGSDVLSFQKFTNAANFVTITANAMTAYENEWVHIGLGLIGDKTVLNTAQFYINGVIQSDNAVETGTYNGMSNTSEPVTIATRPSLGSALLDGTLAHITIMKGFRPNTCQWQELYNNGSPIDPRDATFWSDDFIHYKLDQSEDLESTEGVTNISPNGSCNGTATNMTNAANKITTSFPTN